MKITKLFFIAVFISSTAVMLTNCAKEKGCMDPESKNYSATAEKDDGSCLYEGAVVFWYSKATSDSLLADSAKTLTFYLDGQVVGSLAAGVYRNSLPFCGDDSCLTVIKEIESVKSKSFSFKVVDQTGWTYWNDVLEVSDKTCWSLGLTWGTEKKK